MIRADAIASARARHWLAASLIGASLAAAMCACSKPAPSDERASPSEPSAVRAEKLELRAGPSVVEDAFGAVEGKAVERYTLSSPSGLSLQVITYGAIISSLQVPDRDGKLDDVVLGFADIGGYLAGSPYFGAIVGRVANRVRGARFELDGQRIELAPNDGDNQLHGGAHGWDKLLWTAEPSSDATQASVRLSLVSKV